MPADDRVFGQREPAGKRKRPALVRWLPSCASRTDCSMQRGCLSCPGIDAYCTAPHFDKVSSFGESSCPAHGGVIADMGAGKDIRSFHPATDDADFIHIHNQPVWRRLSNTRNVSWISCCKTCPMKKFPYAVARNRPMRKCNRSVAASTRMQPHGLTVGLLQLDQACFNPDR